MAFAKFLDEAKRKMPGGALMSTSMYRHLHRKKMTDSPQKDADKLLAVLLKVFNTDGDSQVRGAAENALKDVKALMSEEQAAESLALYDEKTDPRDARGSAPSRKILREVTAAIHASVERQHEQDATASKLRMNEFWRKMKERSNVNTTSQPRVSTKGGKVEVTARDKELTFRTRRRRRRHPSPQPASTTPTCSLTSAAPTSASPVTSRKTSWPAISPAMMS